MMMDMLRKSILTGVGLAFLTKERMEDFAREMAKSAQLSAEKGQEFVDEVVQRGEKARADLEKLVQKTVRNQLQKTDLATRDDIEKLIARIDALEARIAGQHH